MKKCWVLGCNKKPEYCHDHYMVKDKYKDKASMWAHLFGILLFLTLGAFFVVPYLTGNVDEDGFCANKLKTYYPEYKVVGVKFDGTACVATINEGNDSRDGLTLSNNQEKSFILTDKSDIAYLQSDDGEGGLCLLGVLLLVAAGIIFGGFMGWLD
jgi:hypothetical protein